MTLLEFSNVFGTLATQLRCTDADEITVRAYFEALKDLELEFVQWAADRFAKSTTNERGEAWFPKTAEWRLVAARIESDRHDQQRAILRKLLIPLCQTCRDTGWAPTPRDPNRYGACACLKLRRLEVLGRRPMPALPPAEDEQPMVPILGAVQALAATKVMP